MSDIGIGVTVEWMDEVAEVEDPEAWYNTPIAAAPRRARSPRVVDYDALLSNPPTVRPQPFALNFSYLIRDVLGDLVDAPEVGFYEHGNERYGALMRQAFSFIRQHGDGRYSSATTMRILSAAEQVEQSAAGARMDHLPTLMTVESPMSYDEETEVKSGGLSALAVCWPHNDGKTVVAVHRAHRRKKHGTLVVRALQDTGVGPLAFWVAASNATAQHFLLDLGFMPTSLNGSGAVRYSYDTPEEA